MDDRAHNLAAVQPLLSGSPFEVRSAEGNEVMAAVDLDLVTPSGAVRVRLTPNVPGEPAFARSASLSISHLARETDAPLPHAAIHALRSFARHVASRDEGGIVLRDPGAGRSIGAHDQGRGGEHDRDRERGRDRGGDGDRGRDRRLPVVAGGTSGSSWSRAIFDRAAARIAVDGGAFMSAVLVVVQPCEMSCRFCPSGDRMRAVPPDLTPAGHHEDLLHQMRAARSIGMRVLEIGGNDVLLYPRAIELFHEAGRIGFEDISAQSPGQRLADPDFARAVAESPLGRVDVPLYGASASDHDGVTQTPGSFDDLCRAIDRVLALRRPAVRLHTIALRSTLHRLDDLIAFGRSRFGIDVRVQMLRPNRLGERDHLGDAASLDEIRAAAARHPDHFGDDVPLCALPRSRSAALHRERVATPGFGRRVHLWDMGLHEGSEEESVKQDRSAVFPAACDGCAARGGCLGVIRAYVDRFGEGAIAPIHGVI